jgi:hypothetical protein
LSSASASQPVRASQHGQPSPTTLSRRTRRLSTRQATVTRWHPSEVGHQACAAESEEPCCSRCQCAGMRQSLAGRERRRGARLVSDELADWSKYAQAQLPRRLHARAERRSAVHLSDAMQPLRS